MRSGLGEIVLRRRARAYATKRASKTNGRVFDEVEHAYIAGWHALQRRITAQESHEQRRAAKMAAPDYEPPEFQPLFGDEQCE